jgi:hypothetical protein
LATITISLSVEPEALERIDVKAKEAKMSRSAYMVKCALNGEAMKVVNLPPEMVKFIEESKLDMNYLFVSLLQGFYDAIAKGKLAVDGGQIRAVSRRATRRRASQTR